MRHRLATYLTWGTATLVILLSLLFAWIARTG